MHELAVADAILHRALDRARREGAVTVEAMRVVVGEVTHLNPAQLQGCLEVVAADTPAADATVEIQTAAPSARCNCGWTGRPDTLEDLPGLAYDPGCPACGDRIELTAGDGCRLAAITVPEAT